MKGKRKRAVWICVFVFTVIVTSLLLGKEKNYQAAGSASSYTNAREFFNSTGQENGKHIDIKDGVIYFATKGKLAHTYTSDYHTYYASRGFDVTLTGGGASVTFAVKIGVSLEEVPGSASQDAAGYHYQLFRISRDTLQRLAENADPVNAKTIFGAESFKVCLDTIIVRRYAGMEGQIEEDGYGGLKITNSNNNYTWVWRLKDNSQLSNAQSVYGGHKFAEYIDIEDDLENYKLDVYYAVDGLPEVSANSSTHVTVASGYNLKNGDVDKDGIVDKYVLFKGGQPNIDSSRLVKRMTILNPLSSGGPAISKTGYHLDKEVAGKEWITESGVTFAAGGTYEPYQLNERTGSGNTSICLYANWQPNTYTFQYDANGGSGTMYASKHTYDMEGALSKNKFSREGYTFKGWSTTRGGAVEYTDGQRILNVTAENEKEIILYAIWERNVYEIILDDDGADTPGSGRMYEGFGTGFYAEESCSTQITSVAKPERTGYVFGGYYDSKNGTGISYIDKDGKIISSNTAFNRDKTIYAKWTPNKYTLALKKEGGFGGADSVMVTYDKVVPGAEAVPPIEAPKRNGFEFKGYYTERNGKGIQFYNENMNSDIVYKSTENTTLYAYWVDVCAPEVSFTGNNAWTNEKTTLKAFATDLGIGLKSFTIYVVSEDGSLTPVVAEHKLNGVQTKELNYTNTIQGVVRYKAVAVDMSGNTAESYTTVYYDTEKPTGDLVEFIQNGDQFIIIVDVTDANTGN